MSLNTQLNDTEARMEELMDSIEALGQVAADEGRELTEDDRTRIDGLTEQYNNCKASKKTLEAAIKAKDQKAKERLIENPLETRAQGTEQLMPARVARIKSSAYVSNFEAYSVGKWLLGLAGRQHDRQWAIDRGMTYQNALSEGIDTAGGYSVPDVMSSRIIELVEEWGVFRRYTEVVTMSSDRQLVPKLGSEVTVSYPGENTTITESNPTFEQVALQPVKMACRSLMSTELSDDSVISVADMVTRSIARRFANAEDSNGFLGDGTATYGSQTGIDNALAAGSIKTASGTALSNIDMEDFHSMLGRLPMYPGIRPVWFMHNHVYEAVVVPLLLALGGTDMRQGEDGGMQKLLGYPVVKTQVLADQNAAAGEMVAVLGDLSLGSMMGVRRTITIRVLNELYADQDSIGIVATQRCTSVIHDVGTATDAGAIVKLDLGT